MDLDLDIIGRREYVSFPELHLEGIEAKIDTGAYTSSLHCHEIQIDEKDGESWVRFKILDPSHPDYQEMEFYLPAFKEKPVKSSSGTTENRVFIKTLIQLFGQVFEVELSLTDRSQMKCPVLIGRKTLKSRFIVDASQVHVSEQPKVKDLLNIAILSRKDALYSTNRLVEAAKERGHQVQVINYLHSYITIDKSKPSLNYEKQSLEHIDAIIPRIGASHTFFGTAVIRQFEMMNVFTVNPSQAITRSRDKLRSHQVLAGAGIDMPSTGFARSLDEVDTVIEQVGGYPIILKLLEGTHGSGVVLVENQRQAKSTLDAFHSLKTNILIQEFIKEAGGEDIRAFVVCGKVVGAMKRTAAKGDFRSSLHKGGKAELVKLSKTEKAVAAKAAKALGLNVAGVDMIRSQRGPLVLEVNSSPGLEGIEKATEKDIAGSIIELIEKNVMTGVRKKQRDKIGA